jgi:hypothetical protein
MTEPTSGEPVEIERVEESAHSESTILDEGLDLAGYKGTHGSPYVADYFSVRDLYKTNPEIQGIVDQITGEMIAQTEGESLAFVVKDLLDQLSGELNLKDNDSGIYKLKKVHKLLSLQIKLKSLDEMKQKALQDIENVVY